MHVDSLCSVVRLLHATTSGRRLHGAEIVDPRGASHRVRAARRSCPPYCTRVVRPDDPPGILHRGGVAGIVHLLRRYGGRTFPIRSAWALRSV